MTPQQVGADQVVAKQVVEATLDDIIEVLATKGRLELRDFGVFEVHTFKARKARSPRTDAEVSVPERRRIRFKAGKAMGKRVADGAALDGIKLAVPVVTRSDSQS